MIQHPASQTWTVPLTGSNGAAAAPRRPSRWPTAAAVGGLIWRAACVPWRFVQARRDLATFGAMSDRELADIGLMRQDLRDATGLRPGALPSVLFAERVGERKRRRHD